MKDRNTMEIVMMNCDVTRSTVALRAKNLKIKTKYYHPKGHHARPLVYYTDSEMEEISNYRKPSKMAAYMDYSQIADLIGYEEGEVMEHSKNSEIKGRNIKIDGKGRIRFSPCQVKSLISYIETGYTQSDKKDKNRIKKDLRVIPENRANGLYHKLTNDAGMIPA